MIEPYAIARMGYYTFVSGILLYVSIGKKFRAGKSREAEEYKQRGDSAGIP
ncbi:MAG: hypothetical protein ACTHJ8_03420 [Mucilaginibacter sp.]